MTFTIGSITIAKTIIIVIVIVGLATIIASSFKLNISDMTVTSSTSKFIIDTISTNSIMNTTTSNDSIANTTSCFMLTRLSF